MKCIFLVEDNQDNADLIRDILSDRFHIIHFFSADEALHVLRGKSAIFPELFLLDISLPGMDGCDLLKEIRQQALYANVPAIALTAHAMSQDRKRFLRAGFEDYVSKPILDEDVLFDAITQLLPDCDARTHS